MHKMIKKVTADVPSLVVVGFDLVVGGSLSTSLVIVIHLGVRTLLVIGCSLSSTLAVEVLLFERVLGTDVPLPILNLKN
jgi:hypothetical protein